MKIEFRNISLRLGEKQVFDNFSLQVGAEEKILLRAPSGRGKSTLLRLVLGFVRPDAGAVLLDGEELTEQNVWKMRSRMAYVSQDLNIGAGRVDDFIREVFDYRANQHLAYDEARILDHFDHFGLERAKLQQPIEGLSGGEKQRVALVVALLLDREAYLLDEVTSSIDEALRTRVVRYLAGIEGKTLVVVSHDQGWEGFRVVNIE